MKNLMKKMRRKFIENDVKNATTEAYCSKIMKGKTHQESIEDLKKFNEAMMEEIKRIEGSAK